MTSKSKAKSGSIKLTLIRSSRGKIAAHKSCVLGLGLKRMHQTVEVQDNPCVRGMIQKVAYLLKVEE